MANMKIEEVEGIGPKSGEKLREAGITNTDALLEEAGTKPGRKGLAEQTGLSEARILTWVNMVDLCRVNGIGPEFAELLQASGVDTVIELATRNPENLAAKCAEVNEEKKLTRRVPTAEVVTGWIAEAKDLPRKVEY